MWYPPRLFILLACPLPSLCRGAMLAAVVPLLVPSGGSPLVPACLMFSAVLRRFAPSLAARAWLRAVSPCVPRLVPHPASSRHRCRCLCCYRPMASRYPPRLIDTTGGASSSPSPSSCVIVRCSVASRAVVVSSCFACLRASRVRSFLRRLRRVCLLSVPLVPPCRRIARLPVRSTSWAGRWRLLGTVFIWFHAMLYASHSCYISRILVIYRAFLLYISYSCYINLFHVILFCRSNAIMGGCV